MPADIEDNLHVRDSTDVDSRVGARVLMAHSDIKDYLSMHANTGESCFNLGNLKI